MVTALRSPLFASPGSRSARFWWPLALWLIAALMILAWFWGSVISDRRAALIAAQDHLTAQVEIAALEISGIVASADLALRTAATMIEANPDWRTLPADPVLWRILHDISAAMPAVPRMLLIDATGALRLHSDTIAPGRVSLADREYFAVHRDTPSDEPRVGTPFLARVSKVPVIPVTRRLSWPDGRFKGVILTNIDPEIIAGFFRSLGHRDRTAFSLVRNDGAVLVLHPPAGNGTTPGIDIAAHHPTLLTNQPTGASVSRSAIDGIERLTAFRRLDRLGLTILAAVPVDIALKPWWDQTWRMGWVITFGLGLISAAAVLLLRHVRAEDEARLRLAVSEACLNRAQAVARVGSWQARLPDLALTCSDEARRLFALPPGTGICRDMVIARIHPDDRRRVILAIRRTTRARSLDIEFRTLIDGAITWVRAKAEVSANPGDGQDEILGTVQDITERRQAEESLRRQAEELARSNTELEQFAYVASHDLREPLRMVASFVDLLGRRYGDRLDQDGREFITFAREGAARMDRLVLDLLDYSRIGRICKPIAPMRLGLAVERATRALALKIEETGARIVVDIAALPTVNGDPDELSRLFQNLIDNALKYRAPTRPPCVTVTALRQGNDWTITIADNGIGIEPQYFERIFRIFQRLHTRESYEGTGIGLAICKKIVERHGGRIWVQSTPGEGCTFRFTLPATVAE